MFTSAIEAPDTFVKRTPQEQNARFDENLNNKDHIMLVDGKSEGPHGRIVLTIHDITECDTVNIHARPDNTEESPSKKARNE